MTPEDFQRGLDDFNRHNPRELIVPIPPGSGICRIANVEWDRWVPGFISSRPGRWTNGGQPSRYFADDVEVCAAELGYFDAAVAPDVVVELWETTPEFPAISIYRLPEPLRLSLYEDRGEPDVKWIKPRILMDVLGRTADYRNVRFIQAPSASGMACHIGGACLVAQDADDVRFISRHRLDHWNADAL